MYISTYIFFLLYVVSFQHMIDNHSFTVLYDRHVNVLVPEETFKGITVSYILQIKHQ